MKVLSCNAKSFHRMQDWGNFLKADEVRSVNPVFSEYQSAVMPHVVYFCLHTLINGKFSWAF